MRKHEIACFYDPKQVVAVNSFSRSPEKPALVLRLLQDLQVPLKFYPFNKITDQELQIAHTLKYIRNFFSGVPPLCTSNSISWTPEFAESVRLTNGSICAAFEHAFLNPDTLTFSPTSGFHHAKPELGQAFCTFSGQVIAAVKLYRKYGVSGLMIDLDAHYGNSIEDTRSFCKDLNHAIPLGCNLNPIGLRKDYLKDLEYNLKIMEKKFLNHELTWICFAQGADSHASDDLKGQLSANEWIQAHTIVYNWIANLEIKLGKHLPVITSLFGGYRTDDYDTVIHLHATNMLSALKILIDNRWDFEIKIKEVGELS